MTRLDQLARWEGRAANHALGESCNRLLVTQAVLDGRDASASERGRRRLDRGRRVHRLCRDNPEIARRQRGRVGGRLQPAQHIACAAEPKARTVDRLDVLPEEIVRPDLDVFELGEVGGEERADRPAAHDAHPHE